MARALAHVSELPEHLRRVLGDGLVVIENAGQPSEAEKLAAMRAMIAEADEDVAHGRILPADDVFSEVAAELSEKFGRT